LRITITAAVAGQPVFFPYNYQYALHAALYGLMNESSADYSRFLHDKGYVKDGIDKLFKLFTFSKLTFTPAKRTSDGFSGVTRIQFVFSTIMEESMKHVVLGIFSNKQMMLNVNGHPAVFDICEVDMEKTPEFGPDETFICLSPIVASTIITNEKGRNVPHFLDYMVPEERPRFVDNLKKNLINKFETIHMAPYPDAGLPFDFSFDTAHITRKKGRISKMIRFKDQIRIKAMEAPFRVKADPALIRIGYECGWGEKNSAGFGCVERAAKT
jgi:CRISPR-associated endoribonuclease Cas6